MIDILLEIKKLCALNITICIISINIYIQAGRVVITIRFTWKYLYL